MSEPATRRTFLAGVAITLSLPLLTPRAQAADATPWLPTIKPDALKDGHYNTDYADKQKFILARSGRKYFALDIRCTHKGCAVRPRGERLVCPCHGAQFDMEGKVAKGPATQSLSRYPLRLNQEGLIEVDTSKKIGDDDTSGVLELQATTQAQT